MSFNIRINKVIIKLQIWDTCGQEVYKSLISAIYRNSSLAIIIYSITNKNSFQHVETWIRDLKTNSNKNPKIILVGNKSDLENERKISYEEGENLKNKHNLNYFIETSAKTGDNAENVLIEAAKLLYKDYIIYKEKKNKENEDNVLNDSQKLGNDKKVLKKKKKCC
jgi:small GTP-binding protein